jgi:Protein of unknown function (DUF1091)
MYCNSSSLTFTNVLCKLRLIPKGALVSFGFETTKNIDEANVIKNVPFTVKYSSLIIWQIDILMEFKIYNQWRRIVSIPSIKLCDVLKSENPFLKSILANYRIFMPWIPKSCPFKPGRYYQHNVSIIDLNYWKGSEDDAYYKTGSALPNGIYRGEYKIDLPGDPKAYFFQHYYRIQRRFNYGNI